MGGPLMAGMRRGALSMLALSLLAMLAPALPPKPALAADVIFGTSRASGALGQDLLFETDVTSPVRPVRVELLSHLSSERAQAVRVATLTDSSAVTYKASVTDTRHTLPNTSITFRFRATLPNGATALGPEATFTVEDKRFAWKTLEGDIVRLHWYQGDEAFAHRAVQIGDDAIHGAEQLLGVKETSKVDFFIYAAQQPFRDALGPGTRENVGGQAVAAIRTLFGLIDPAEINSSWVDVLVTHELTHLVFTTAVDNPYHLPPRWLNEGLAVFRSQGYDLGSRAQVARAAKDGSIFPLDGLAGFFPTGAGFALGYAESVSAVSYIITTFGQDALVKLIRSYAGGVTDDEAFSAAIGRDTQTLDTQWLASIGATPPKPLGPQAAPQGPLPPGWSALRFGPGMALLR